ncbi:MAG TPA: hypothetical protein VLG27_02300, partial [Candidatus Saccharimonadia bacterium]|nr:hypothetical protein [Candidatus Saccharimonadia bacterium]
YERTGKKLRAPKPRQAKEKTDPEDDKATPEANSERVYIRLADTSDEQTLLSLKQAIDAHSGQTEVVLVLGEATSKQAIKLPGGIDTQNGSLSQLKELVGPQNVVVQ